ncbi:MAG: tripartite tricarboxylate transporter TctB family protein [Pseudomonadota bacterium]
MKTRWSGEQNWCTALMLFLILLLLAGFSYPKEVRMLPFVVGFPTLLLLVILWLGGIYPGVRRRIEMAGERKKDQKAVPDKVKKGEEFTDWKPVLIVMAWVFLFFILVFFFGFALVSPVFITCFLIRKASMRWQVSALYSVIATVLIYVFMEGLINADLWSGAIPEIIPGYLGGAIIPPL